MLPHPNYVSKRSTPLKTLVQMRRLLLQLHRFKNSTQTAPISLNTPNLINKKPIQLTNGHLQSDNQRDQHTTVNAQQNQLILNQSDYEKLVSVDIVHAFNQIGLRLEQASEQQSLQMELLKQTVAEFTNKSHAFRQNILLKKQRDTLRTRLLQTRRAIQKEKERQQLLKSHLKLKETTFIKALSKYLSDQIQSENLPLPNLIKNQWKQQLIETGMQEDVSDKVQMEVKRSSLLYRQIIKNKAAIQSERKRNSRAESSSKESLSSLKRLQDSKLLIAQFQ